MSHLSAIYARKAVDTHIDIDAFHRLYNAYYDSLFRFVNLYAKDRYTSQDIVQEVFLRLWDRRDRIRITYAKAYLFHMGRNAILNKIRDTKERFYLLEKLPEIADCEAEVDAEWGDPEALIEMVHEAIDGLPPKCRGIFIMNRHQMMTYKQIAAVKGISRKTVENQIGIALKKIRSYVMLRMAGKF